MEPRDRLCVGAPPARSVGAHRGVCRLGGDRTMAQSVDDEDRQVSILRFDAPGVSGSVFPEFGQARASGFNVVEARSGAEALRAVEQERPDVVLLDANLPDISGPDVCVYIKQRWPEVMVLMTSATFTSAEDRTFGLDAGADSYLLQPADRIELAAAVNSLLWIRRTEDDLRSLNATLERKVRLRAGARHRTRPSRPS